MPGFYEQFIQQYGVEKAKIVANIEFVLKKIDQPDRYIINTNNDLNDFRDAGFYYTPLNQVARTLYNSPWGNQSSAAVSFSLQVVTHAGVTQILYVYNVSGEEWQRQYYDGVWGSWVRMVDTQSNLTITGIWNVPTPNL
jgi:hypothetical protein